MSKILPEVVAANFAFIAFWLVIVLFILIGGGYLQSIQSFRNKMLAKRKPAATARASPVSNEETSCCSFFAEV